MGLLNRISIRNAECVLDAHGAEVLHVKDPHALIQASGYLKYIQGLRAESIFFRGQSKIYPSLSPTLFRGIGVRQAVQSRRVADRNRFILEIAHGLRIFATFPNFAHEPLLQHYGLSTTWIDLVDNIWVALWFACYQAHVSGKNAEYLHFERRRPVHLVDYAYILLVASDSQQVSGVPGLFKGPSTELVDLRVACPSIFLRPHAQHGVLFRRRGVGVTRPTDYSDRIRGIIRMSLTDALQWLGNAPTLSAHSLFPPPFYDHGYKLLLEGGFKSPSKIGSILVIGT